MDRYAIENGPGAGGGPVYIHNNTFYNNGRKPPSWLEPPPHILNGDSDPGDFEVKNNIFYSELSDKVFYGNTANSNIDYNIYYTEGATPADAYGGHSQIADPQFKSIADHDVSLLPSSPAIDAGIDVGLTFNGQAPDVGALEILTTTVNVDTDEEQPRSHNIIQNYPNPFNPSTNIFYEITRGALVQLRVTDLLGRSVSTLVNDSKQPGSYEVQWEGKDAKGAEVSSGVYLLILRIVESSKRPYSVTRKIALIR
jgi:hypothetical protein